MNVLPTLIGAGRRNVASSITALALLVVMARAGIAQGAQAGRGDTEILLLGTHGGPYLSEGRSESSSLLIVDGRAYLIDCGIGTMRRLLRAGVRSETIGKIFLTHLHPDHVLDLASVMANDVLNLGPPATARRIDIYGPPPTEDMVKAAFRYISIPFGVFAAEPAGPRLADPFVVREIRHAGLVYQDDKIRVVAAENSHYALMPARYRTRMKSYSYRFETPHGVVVFTGDTGPSAAVRQLATGADVLVSVALDRTAMDTALRRSAARNHWAAQHLNAMLAHMRFEILDVKEIGELASEARAGSVVLTHLGPDGIAPDVFVSGVKQVFTGSVFVGADLDRYCLSGPAAGGSGTATLTVCR